MITDTEQPTCIMRQLGAAYDPNTVCRYTGKTLHKVPSYDGWLFVREDGVTMRYKPYEPAEVHWMQTDPSWRQWALGMRAWQEAVHGGRIDWNARVPVGDALSSLESTKPILRL